MTTRLLALALFAAAIYYLLTRQRPTPPMRFTGEQAPPGDDFIKVWVYTPPGVNRKVS